jgi:hypothetical protein
MTNTSKNEPGLRQLSTAEVDAVAGASLSDVVKMVRDVVRVLTMKGPQV